MTATAPPHPRTARFWDRLARRYARKPVPDAAAYAEKLRRTRAHFTPESQVLEVGCGTGSTALAHAPFVGRILASDISGAMIDIARDKAAAAGVDNVVFHQAPLQTMTPAPGAFDVALALNILHLVEDVDAALSLLFAALKPGGVLVSSTAGIAEVAPVLRYLGPFGVRLGLLPDLNVMTGDQIRAAHDRAGFQVLEEWRPERGAVFIEARKPH